MGEGGQGRRQRLFPWGDDWDPAKANGPPNGSGTTPVGSFPLGVSPFGVHDLAGNVWEWVADWYGANYLARVLPPTRPVPPREWNGSSRGGSWFSSQPVSVSATFREHTNGYEFGIRDEMTGFRCARDVRSATGSGYRR